MNQIVGFDPIECSFGTCLSIFNQKQKIFKESQIQLLILGLNNSGKTSVAKSIAGESHFDLAPTIGINRVKTKYKGLNVTILDLGGSKSTPGVWMKHFHESHGFIFVIDSSDLKRLQETAEAFAEIVANQEVQGKPFLMLCNKSDKSNSKDETQIAKALQVEKLVNVSKCPTRIEPCIANKNKGLKEGFQWLVKNIGNQLDILGPRIERAVEDAIKHQRKMMQCETDLRKNNLNHDPDTDQKVVEPSTSSGFVPVEEIQEILVETQLNNFEPLSARASPVQQEKESLNEESEMTKMDKEINHGPEPIPDLRYHPTVPDIEEEQPSDFEYDFNPGLADPLLSSQPQPSSQEQRIPSIENIPAVIAEDLFLASQSFGISKLSNRRGSNQSCNSSSSNRRGKVELEPIVKPKKTTVLKKMNSRGSRITLDNSRSNLSKGSRKIT